MFEPLMTAIEQLRGGVVEAVEQNNAVNGYYNRPIAGFQGKGPRFETRRAAPDLRHIR